MSAHRVLTYGDTALLLEVDEPGGALACFTALRERSLAGVLDVVPAARTVLVRFDPATTTAESVARELSRLPAGTVAPVASAPAVELPVVYDGADLGAVAAELGWSVERLVGEHTAAPWQVAFTGFAPGFGYLVRPDWPSVARRADPRPSVPTGSVGLADRYSGVYPRASPGGWRLVGHTGVPLWDAAADPPAVLVPGTEVRFVVAP